MPSSSLDSLTQDLARGSLRVALEQWQAHRAGALGELIGRATGPAASRLPRGSEASMVAWTLAWRSSPLEHRGPLAGQFVELLPQLTHRFAKATLQFIAEQSADPRLGEALAASFRTPPRTFDRPLVLRAFVAAMVVHADARHAQVLERLAHGATRASANALGARNRALRELPPLAPGEVKALKSLTLGEKPVGSPAVEDRLWQAVYAAPADLELRAVLADALLAADDPRGAFIAAQLRGTRAPPAPALLPVLLGPLAAFLEPDSVTFENGFPVRGVLVKLSTPRQQVALQCREWATFERIDGLARLSPQLRSLTSTSGLPDKAVEEWVARRWPIPLKAIALPLDCAALVPRLPTAVETVEFSVFMDDVELDELFPVLAAASTLKHVVLGEPYVSTGQPWPLWSDAALALTSLESLTWRGTKADLTFTSRERPFDTLEVFSKSAKKPKVMMKHPAKRVVHHAAKEHVS